MRVFFTAGVLIAVIILAIGLNAPALARGQAHFGHSARGSHSPPGWSHGEKVGWGGAHMPPGLRRH